jgi:amino acid permease
MARTRIERLAPVWAIVTLVVLGLLLIAVGIVYFSEPARHLPSFFPGHAAGSTRHHSKHGLLAVVIGLVAFVGAWVGSGRKRRRWDG